MTLDDFKSALFINIHFKEKHSELPVIEAKYFYSINSTIKFSKTYNKIISNYLKKEQ